MRRSMDRQMLDQGLVDSLGIVEELPEAAIQAFAETGRLAILEALPDESFGILKGVCKRMFTQPLPLTRAVKDPKWHNVDKVTLFRDPSGTVEATHSMRFHAPELVLAAAWADGLVRSLGKRLSTLGQTEAAALLSEHHSKRAVINRMNGTDYDKAVLGIHTDVPAERGANTSLVMDEGLDLLTAEETAPNTLNIYACLDVCDALGIPQPPHGFSSSVTRMVTVFTHFEN